MNNYTSLEINFAQATSSAVLVLIATPLVWDWLAHRSPSMRVALYGRVSTKNNGQNPETQLVELREYSARRGFEIADEYVDLGMSGSDSSLFRG